MASLKNKPLVEVIVLSHNGIENNNILACLDSLKKTNYPNFKVIVVDRKSDDNTGKIVKQKHPWVKVVRNGKESFSEANNDYLRNSDAKYCIMLNDDTEQDSEWIKEMVALAESNPQIAAIQPKVRSLRNRKMLEYAGAAGGYMDPYGYPICRGRVFDSMEEDFGQYDDARQIFWACGVAMFLRMSVLKKVGYLDEFIGTYFEELDLSWRLNLSGYKVYYSPKSVIYHKGSAVWGKKKYRFDKEFWLNRNSWIVILKNHPLKSLWKVAPIRLMLDIITFIAFLFKNPIKSLSVLRADLWILFNLPRILKKNREISLHRKVSGRDIERRMINTITPLRYFLLRQKKFRDFTKYISDYRV